jgi:hypothetical protein
LSEREKMALRFVDFLKYDPQGVSEEFLEDLKGHYSDAEIVEMGFFLGAYGGAHNLFSAIKERVLDDDGNDISDSQGFPIVFDTHDAVTRWQSEEEAAIDGPLPEQPAQSGGAHAHRPSDRE